MNRDHASTERGYIDLDRFDDEPMSPDDEMFVTRALGLLTMDDVRVLRMELDPEPAPSSAEGSVSLEPIEERLPLVERLRGAVKPLGVRVAYLATTVAVLVITGLLVLPGEGPELVAPGAVPDRPTEVSAAAEGGAAVDALAEIDDEAPDDTDPSLEEGPAAESEASAPRSAGIDLIDPTDGVGPGDPPRQAPSRTPVTTGQTAPANGSPRALFTPSAVRGDAPLAVSFESEAWDPDGDPLSHRWDFGDGTVSLLESPNHVFVDAGEYRVTLRVSDGELSDELAMSVSVTAAVPPVPPVSDFPVPLSCVPSTSPFWFIKVDGGPFGDGRNVYGCETITLTQWPAPENIGERFSIQFERCWADRILVDHGSDGSIEWVVDGGEGICRNGRTPAFSTDAEGSGSVTITAVIAEGGTSAYYLAGYRE